MRDNNKLTKLVTAALMAAMTCIVTMILPIKIPYGNGGYIHPGDGFVLLSGIILGPVYGGFAAAIGSLIADILAGYVQYAIATFVIKFLAAMVAGYIYRFIRQRFNINKSLIDLMIANQSSVIVAGVFGGIIVTSGYFAYECFLYGSTATALVAVPFNLIQNAMGIIIASIILPLLYQVPQIRTMINTK